LLDKQFAVHVTAVCGTPVPLGRPVELLVRVRRDQPELIVPGPLRHPADLRLVAAPVVPGLPVADGEPFAGRCVAAVGELEAADAARPWAGQRVAGGNLLEIDLQRQLQACVGDRVHGPFGEQLRVKAWPFPFRLHECFPLKLPRKLANLTGRARRNNWETSRADLTAQAPRPVVASLLTRTLCT